MLYGAIAFLWFIIVVLVIVDIFRRPSFSTGLKIAWTLGVLILPVIGVLAYVIMRPPDRINELQSSDAGMLPGDENYERYRDRHPI
jgi:hypothetical protein